MKTWQNFAGNSGTATTTWNYDANRGWLQGKSYADGLGPLYTNTAAGRPQTRTWARSVAGQRLATTYGYNNIGDLTTVTYSDGSPGITYGYDRQGRRTSALQAGITTTSTFNDTGLLLSESFSGGPLNGLSVTNGYDEFLRRTNLVLQQSSNPLIQQSFGYDDYSRLHSVAEGDNTATYSYVAYSSRVGQIDFSHQNQTVMSTLKEYDGLNRLTNISTFDASQVLDSHAYVYNSANQRTSHTLADGSYWVYTYDGLGQVTSGKKFFADGSPVPGQQFTYGFDDIGNRKSAGSGGDQYGGNLHVQNYSANNLNQYTSRTVQGFADVIGSANSNATVTLWGDNAGSVQTIRRGEYFYGALPVNNSTGTVWLTLTNIAVLPDGTNPDIVTNTTGKALVPKTAELFTYDVDGNLTSDSLWTNTWNAENRRSLVESRTAVAAAARAREQWTYLPDGRWIERIVSVWNGSGYRPQSTNRYVWDGQVLVAILDHTNGIVLSFLRGLDLSGLVNGAGSVGGLTAVSQWSNSQVSNSHFACFDGNGNVMGLVSANDGALSAEYEYEAFGEVIRATGPMARVNPFRWSTQYTDDETDLVIYRARPYRPSTGRFLCKDPIDEMGGLHLYSFVVNNPVNRFDPFGLRDYRKGTDDPTITPDPGAGAWKSEDWTPGNVALKQLIVGNIAIVWIGMPDAVKHLMHYFGNSGSDYTIRLQGMIDEVPSAKRVYNNEIALAQAFVESLAEGKHKITSGAPSGSADGAYNTKSESKNWFYAVGGYSAWGKGTASVCKDEYTLEFEYKFYDRYNWDTGKSVMILGATVTDAFMGEFHREGLAREFDMRGSVKKTVTWKKGQAAKVRDGWDSERGR